MSQKEIQAEALDRAQNNTSMTNYPAIYAGFLEKGIAMHDITPRVNVLTFHAWKAKGRRVKAGEHGVKVNTWISRSKEIEVNGETEVKVTKFPRVTTVFHISQTRTV